MFPLKQTLLMIFLFFSSVLLAQPPCSFKNDFSYNRSPCAPFNISFLTAATGYTSIQWNFGDGNNANGLPAVTNNYLNPGNYLVTMITAYPGCSDTVKKNITIGLQVDNQLISTSDTLICAGATKQISGTAGLNFCWSPSLYLDNPNSNTPTTSTPVNITYYYTAEIPGNNIIVNGNFNAGNSGFTSAYNYATPNITEGQYFVGTSPQAWNPSLSNCTDHTSGNGNMMLVNGSPAPNLRVWEQTVNVTANTNYAFSTWIQALWPPNPAQLQFSINGNDIGTLITASLPTCSWTQFFTMWNSGANTTATISIINKNTLVQGNDFALDDISFAPVILTRDSVRITVETPVVSTTASTAICEGSSLQLNTTGALLYNWSPATGLNNPAIANPVASPVVNTRYFVSGTTANGCTGRDTVDITINPKPFITRSANDTICTNNSIQLSASGGIAYSWSPAATLNNPAVANPVASPASTTTYTVSVTGANNCSNTDSVKITVRSPNSFTINTPVNTCPGKPVQLTATGADQYLWQPALSLSNPAMANPTASPAATTVYTVQLTDTLCNNTSTLSTTVTVLPLPIINANKSNDIDCSNPQSQLTANGAVQYSWSPAAGLNNASSSSPVAAPGVTTRYTVTGTDAAGCINTDTVTVNVSDVNKGGYLMPTGFTPNNDGLNDCYGIKYWGTILELEFSIYSRWGERIFFTRDPAKCWDGRYKGLLQDGNVFIYMIKAKTSCEGAVFRKGTFVLIR